MQRSWLRLIALAGFCALALTPEAAAFGRRCRPAGCAPSCHPAFSFHAHLLNPSGYIPYDPRNPVRLPFEVAVTNWECYAWTYTSPEYQYYLFDRHGCIVPNAFVLTTDLRTITVLPRTSVLDQPNVLLNTPVLQEGWTYTVVVVLRGRAACFTVTPFLERKKA